MLTYALPILSAIVCAIIDWIRICVSYGKVININKVLTWTVGAFMWGVCLALNVGYYDEVSLFGLLFYAAYYASVRGVLYDIILNVLRGLSVSYKSKTTNSILDRIFNKIAPFYSIRIGYLVLTIIFGALCYFFPLT